MEPRKSAEVTFANFCTLRGSSASLRGSLMAHGPRLVGAAAIRIRARRASECMEFSDVGFPIRFPPRWSRDSLAGASGSYQRTSPISAHEPYSVAEVITND